MTTTGSTLIVPVENQVRELDAKLLLGCVAAERGFSVVLGSRTYINFAMPFLPRGVFLAKSMRSISKLMFGFIRDLGNDIVAWDEESLVRFSSPEYYAWRFSQDTFSAVSRLFAWGADDAELFMRYPGYTGVPVHVTGNPRVDLLRRELRGFFAPEADALRERFGEFILINTNFPFVNAFVPALNLLQPCADGAGVRVGRTGRGMSLEFARGYAAHIQAVYDAFRALVPQLGKWFPQHNIIVRPHPSEDHAVWRRVAAGSPNVHVLHEGNAAPWLMACSVLVHNGCTTAVEAAVLERPAVAYRPVISDCFDYPLPNALSHNAYSLEELRSILTEVLEGRLGCVSAATRDLIFARHLAATSGPLAADRVIDVLQQAGYGARAPRRPGLRSYVSAWLGTNGRTLVKLVNMRRPQHRNSAAYHAHRFPEIPLEAVERRIERYRRLLGRFENVRVERHSKHIFRVVAASQRRSSAQRAGGRVWSAGQQGR